MGNKRVPIEEFTMPFGKYKGEKFGNLYYKDKGYLLWLADNIKDGTVGARAKEFLDKMNGYEDQIEQPLLNLGCEEKEPDPDWTPQDRVDEQKDWQTSEYNADDIPF